MDRDAIEVLDDEHAGLETLFARVSGADEDRRAVLKQLLQTLSLHISMEKQILVPIVKDRLPDGDAAAAELTKYHDDIEHIQVLLDRRKVNSPDVPDLVTQLLDLTDGHIAAAKDTLFPSHD
jgi:Hemerythrin HHE cation binding domain